MPELLKKSEENFYAASLLIGHRLFAPSIHCSYYACFQRLKNVVAKAYHCGYDDLRIEQQEHIDTTGKSIGSHEFLINFKLSNLLRRENMEHRVINEINQIKLFRHKSDYENVQTGERQATMVLKKSEFVLDELKELETLLG